jgi:large subunit ribosomal protein L21
MYAVIETGGKQYRVEEGDTLLVEDLEKVKVEAKIAGHERGPKIRVFKYRPKKGYRKRQGHRSELTRLEVTEIKMLSRKPAGSAKKEESNGS